MWKNLCEPWKTVFEEAWIAFKKNSVPTGAAVYDSKGNLLAKDHNRRNEADVLNRNISHSDVNVLSRLDLRNNADPSEMTLYSSMEPCHMCLGMIYMTGIKKIRSAAADLHLGMAHLLYEDAFLRSRKIDYKSIGGDAELFQLVIQSYYEIKHRKDSSILECYRRTNNTAVEIAEKLYFRRILDQYAVEEKTCEAVFDMILRIKEEKYS